MPTPLLIGIGNIFRGDDAAGLMVADAVARENPDVRAVRHEGEGAGLITAWEGAEEVILVDTAVSGAPPGTIHRLDGCVELPRAWFGVSTHTLNVAEAVEMAKVLGRLPRRLRVYGIEGRDFTLGAPLSPDVDAAVRRVVAEISGFTD